MPIETRADGVLLARLTDDPQLATELEALLHVELRKPPAVVLDVARVTYLNSSHLSRLLRLRQRVIMADGKLVICGAPAQVLGVFHATGLDKVFTLVDDEGTAAEWAKVHV
jgi:anti-anti-sigma factor